MCKHFLPKAQNHGYSPLGVSQLFNKAEKENNGDLNAILKNKKKYKNLWEMYHGSFLALALYKKFGPKYQFDIVEGQDPPDLYFVQRQGKGAIPVEVMELYKYGGNFKNYSELANHIWNTKGHIRFEKCHLLLASRMSTKKFNVAEFVKEFQKFNWHFERVWLSIYSEDKKQWTFFEVFPPAQYNASNFIYFNLEEDKKLWY